MRTLFELNINLQLFIIVIIRILLIKFAGSSRVTKLLQMKIVVSYTINCTIIHISWMFRIFWYILLKYSVYSIRNESTIGTVLYFNFNLIVISHSM